MKKILFFSMLLIFSMLTHSCNKDYLNVDQELADELDMEKVFSNPQDVRRFHRVLYTDIPNSMSFMWWSVFYNFPGQTNIWALMSDDLMKFAPDFPYKRPVGIADTGITSRWGVYRLIRQANLFLENAKEIPLAGTADFLGAEELENLRAQARFFRAYYHYLLFELYGPIPIMETSANPKDPDLDFARSSVDEVVNWLYKELTEVADGLINPDLANQQLLGVPTRGTALAVRARLMMYAASPLFNGGYQEALGAVNHDGKRLFPDHDPNKWNLALIAVQEMIDYANSGHYELHKEYTNGILNPQESVHQVHMKFNKELIFVRTEDNSTQRFLRLDVKNIPRGARIAAGDSGGLAVTQELVDAFHMVDGLPIDESPLYKETGFSVAGEDVSDQTAVGTRRMFINREPRFYQTVFYNGRRWHIGNEQIWFNLGGNSDKNAARYVKTGHLLYKRMDRTAYNQGTHLKPDAVFRTPVVFRLAEFFLLYAEALNETDPNDSRIIEYIDKVRERAGIPLLRSIKPQIAGNQQAQREAIRAEMRVELCTEGQRYHDLRRWMIAADGELGKGKLNGSFYGMDMDAPTLEGFYQRTVVVNRVFERKNYLLPIPLDEIQKSRLLVQNPGF